MTDFRHTSWPAVGYETLPWTSLYSRDDLTRRQWEGSRGPYEPAIPAPIARIAVVLDAVTNVDAADASTLLTRFDAELGTTGLPFATVLLRTESASSSEIENLTSGVRAIAEAELGERATGNAALIVRNVRAMTAAIELADRIDTDSILAMQDALLGHHSPELTGRYRDEQVWIGGGGVSPHGAAFVPPHHSRVGEAMDDLIAFIRRDDVPVLAQAAIAHAQFETVHPFPDGNGRTGRAIVQAILRNKRLTTNVTVPVSAGLLHDVDAYYAALTAYRTGDPNPIVRAFTDAAGYAVRNGRQLVNDIRRVEEDWSSAMQGIRADATARRLAALAIGQPVLNQAVVTAQLQVAPLTAYRALDALVERGVLRTANSKSRNRIWIADTVIGALDEFAARAGRRTLPSRG